MQARSRRANAIIGRLVGHGYGRLVFGRSSTSTLAVVGVLVGLLAGAILGAGALGGTGSTTNAGTDDSADGGAAATDASSAAGAAGVAVPPEDYLTAWRRHHLAEVAVEGRHAVVIDDRTGGDLPVPDDAAVVRRARRGDVLLDQLGTQVTMGDAEGVRSCLITPAGDLVCGPTGRGNDVDALTAAIAERFVERAPDTGDYRAFAVDPPTQLLDGLPVGVETVGCWSLVAERAVPLAPWGQVTTECFDADSGALVWSLTRRADELTLFIASSVRSDVGDTDLEPLIVDG